MVQRIGKTLWLMLLLAPAVPVLAEEPVSCFVRSVVRDFKRRNCWPEPFICPDRAAVQEPFMVMVARGWERQNLLWDQFFEQGRPDLNEAGRLKVHWILTEAPSQHRVIYLQRCDRPEQTAARVAAVRQYAAQISQGQSDPAIVETNIAPPGTPAERIDVINRKFITTLPDPKLPDASSTDSGTK
jgi:hypothetical protein